MAPCATEFPIEVIDGWNRTVCPTISEVPPPSVASTMASKSATVSAAGFSTCTCFPARPAAIVTGAWSGVAPTTLTACTLGSARIFARSVLAFAPGANAATDAARSKSLPNT